VTLKKNTGREIWKFRKSKEGTEDEVVMKKPNDGT